MWQKLYAPGARKGNRNWITRGEDAHGVRYEVDLRTANERAAGRRARKYEAKRNSRPPETPVEAPAAEPAVHTYRDALERYIDFRRPSQVDLDRHAKIAAFRLEGGRRIADLAITDCGQDEMVQYARALLPDNGAWPQRAAPIASIAEPSSGGQIGELLTGEQLMDEVTTYCAAIGNEVVGKALRDGFEGRCLKRDKGVLVHAVKTSLKVEEVTMYRRTAPKVVPIKKAEATNG